MDLDDSANIIFLVAHEGPHPEAYHNDVYQRLDTALGRCSTVADCKSRLIVALDRLAADICLPGSKLNKLLTRNP